MPQIIVGCDLSHAFIDVCINAGRTTLRIENTKLAIAEWLGTLDATALVVFEATSGCHGLLMEALDEGDIAYVRVNPCQARESARALGVLTKTDKVDARPGPDGPMPAAHSHDTTGARQKAYRRLPQAAQVVGRSAQGRKAAPPQRGAAGVAPRYRKHDRHPHRRIGKLDKEIATIISESQPLAALAQWLSAVPGVGPTVLATLLGELPELGILDRPRLASLAGLAPYTRESGTWKGARRIWGERRKVRDAPYIAALTATRGIPAPIALRQRMRAAGKAPKTILIAAGRQLLVILNAMIRNNQAIRL